MGKGNERHWPPGTPIGGQFAPKGVTGIVRGEPMEEDVEWYTWDENFGKPNATKERIELINKSLYAGGYIEKTGDTLCGFESIEDAEDFIFDIGRHEHEKRAWKKNKKLVETYVNVVRGYLDRNKFDLVINGKKSEDGSKRIAEELTEEFGWNKEDVRRTLLNCLSADDFVNSGANNSRYVENQGTVVMIFSPRVETKIGYTDSNGQKRTKRKVVDLYVKMVLNPHPDRKRGQTEMQILSFREAGVTKPSDEKFGKTKPKVCMYTGEERHSRAEWATPTLRGHKDRPLTQKELMEKKQREKREKANSK